MFFKKVRSYEKHFITTRLWILKETKTNKNYRSYRNVFKMHSEKENVNLPTRVNHHFVANRSLTLVHFKANASFAWWNAHYAKPNPSEKLEELLA